MNEPTCKWKEDKFDCYWESECGSTWCFEYEAKPGEHDLNFCQKCGKRIVDVTPEPEKEEDEP